MNKRSMAMVCVLSAFLLLTLTVGLSLAQGPGDAPQGVTTIAPGAIPIQGRLTNTSGNPLSGTYSIMFRLYETDLGGTAVCTDTRSVNVVNGLFSDYMDGCYNDITGQKLWLGVQVGGDQEMLPRQLILPVPYAISLVPKAEISGTVGSNDAILDIDNYGTNGKGLRAEAQGATGVNYGVVGAARSLDGYGGYFYNNGGGIGLGADSDGIALQLTGSGRIESTADMTIAVSPLKMIPQWESIGDLEFLSDGAYMELRPVTSGYQYVHIPVDVPSALFGTTTKLKSVRICYKCDQAGSFVATTILSQGTDSGTLSQSINDTTSRTNTSWECYTVTDATPDAIQGSVYIQLTLSFAGTGSTHDIRIGNIALRLTEQ
jgi:hypothetical protein